MFFFDICFPNLLFCCSFCPFKLFLVTSTPCLRFHFAHFYFLLLFFFLVFWFWFFKWIPKNFQTKKSQKNTILVWHLFGDSEVLSEKISEHLKLWSEFWVHLAPKPTKFSTIFFFKPFKLNSRFMNKELDGRFEEDWLFQEYFICTFRRSCILDLVLHHSSLDVWNQRKMQLNDSVSVEKFFYRSWIF